MKTSIKLFRIAGLIALLVLTTTIRIYAQQDKPNDKKKPPKPPEERTEIIVKNMTKKLLLGNDQLPKVHDIILEREKQKDLDIAVFKADKNKEKFKQAKMARNKKADDALKIVLNDQQFQELLKWRKEAKQKKKNNPNPPDGNADDSDAE